MKTVIFALICSISCLTWAAEKPLEILGTFGEWTAYTYTDSAGKVCYMSAEPEKSVGKYNKRGDVFLMVQHRPNDKGFDVVNTVAGYTYKKNSTPTISVDGKVKKSLIVQGDKAWARDAATDKHIVQQLKAGSKAVLTGVSVRGTKTTDTFSLKGFSKAYNEISKACGL